MSSKAWGAAVALALTATMALGGLATAGGGWGDTEEPFPIDQQDDAVDKKCKDAYFDPWIIIIYEHANYQGDSLKLCRMTVRNLHDVPRKWGYFGHSWGDVVSSIEVIRRPSDCKSEREKWYVHLYENVELGGRVYDHYGSRSDLRIVNMNDRVSSMTARCV